MPLSRSLMVSLLKHIIIFQVTQGVVAPVHNPEFAEVVYETQVPSAATSFCAQPPAPKRPCRESPRVVVPTPSIENLQTMRTARQRSYFNCVCEASDLETGLVMATFSFRLSASWTMVITPSCASGMALSPRGGKRNGGQFLLKNLKSWTYGARGKNTTSDIRVPEILRSLISLLWVLVRTDKMLWFSLARHPQAQPITVDSALEASVHDCAVDIVCWDDHARSAKALKVRRTVRRPSF